MYSLTPLIVIMPGSHVVANLVGLLYTALGDVQQ